MERRDFMKVVGGATAGAVVAPKVFGAGNGSKSKPNLVVVHTDEHNFRTLGCYRDLIGDEQAFIWGDGVMVDTPNIDSIARDGAVCTSYYAASPVCTPSRASLVTGLYPQATGSPSNDMPLNDDTVTFAEVLKRNGYATSYVGKWHLDGDAKPGVQPERKFGFDDNRYMINRGHWKMLKDTENGCTFIGKFNEKKNQYKFDMEQSTQENFTTDFLMDRTIEIIERDKSKPFCVMLSIPDPHGPNNVRKPYEGMYSSMTFQEPRTMNQENRPKWNGVKGKNVVKQFTDKTQTQHRWYFGMVKCIDDNVGKLLKYLKDNGLDKNTIVVFTSDHGDMMGEHNRNNKGLPYESSALIPFVIKYPGEIVPGKVIKKAYTNVDFAPTVLGMMGIDHSRVPFHGEDTSADFLSSQKKLEDDRIVYYRHAGNGWVSAVSRRYKLVVSTGDKPWLFDLEKDPDELTNYFSNPEYASVVKKMSKELRKQMAQYNEPNKEKMEKKM